MTRGGPIPWSISGVRSAEHGAETRSLDRTAKSDITLIWNSGEQGHGRVQAAECVGRARWEIVGYAAGSDAKSGVHNHSVLLRRQKQHKILQVRNKFFGKGQVATEIDL